MTADVPLDDGLVLRVDDRGAGRPVLLLHGGGGPMSVAALADQLVDAGLRVITPTVPGFDGTARPPWLDAVPGLARVYRRLLGALSLRDVAVVGSSLGGWVGAVMALDQARDPAGPLGRLVVINGVGIRVPGHPVTDLSGLTPDRIADYAYFDPDRYRIDPSTLPPAAAERLRANAEQFAVYAGGPSMGDPDLLPRLATVRVPVLVVWGAADRVVDVDYGRAYADAFGGEFVVVERAGHLPFVERPEVVRELVVGAVG